MTNEKHEAGCLQIADLSVEFGGLRALQNVSVTLRPGRVLGIVGPNGAGKTTLFNVVSGVVRASSGSVRLDGVELSDLPSHQRTRQGLSRTFQNLALNDEMSVLENVLMGAQRHVPLGFSRLIWDGLTRKGTGRERSARAEAHRVIERLGLSDDSYRRVEELPFGTRRRVDLARALCGRPRAVLLDEPFSGLGDRERPLMSEIIRSIGEDGDTAIVLVEHDMTVVSALCDELLVLNEGAVIGRGEPAQVLADPDVQEAYLGPELKRRRRTVAA